MHGRADKVNLHPTMYLLIPGSSAYALDLSVFTSHYVSINSLLFYKISHYIDIYIPLCIY